MRLKEKEAQNACKEAKAYFLFYKMFNYLGYKEDVYSRIKNPLRGKSGCPNYSWVI